MPAEEQSTNLDTQAYWKEQLDCTRKDPDYQKFIEQGKKIVKRYLNKSDNDLGAGNAGSLNLFHSNVVTLESMLFGQTPKVNVDRRWDDPNDDIARVAGNMLERMMNTDIGLRTDKYSTSLKKALHDYLTVGLGQSRVRYEAIYKSEQVTAVDAMTGVTMTSFQNKLDREYCHIDYVYWQDFMWNIGRSWEECEWVAFRTWMRKEEVATRFGEDVANQLEYQNKKGKDDDGTKYSYQCAAVWEIWSKGNKKVYWYSESAKDLLDKRDDTLKLWGFFPCSQPMMANLTTTKLVPRADYIYAQDLYMEIETLQQRIEFLTRAVKVVGVYDQSAGPSIGRMLTEGVDNTLIPVDNWAMFAEKGGIKGQIDWLPLEQVVNALTQVTKLRDDSINMLYQLTGMSDIMRGQGTEGRTSATEQSLKAKFASTKVQALQDMFAYFATDLQMLKANVIVMHYDPQTIVKQSGVLLTPDAEMAGQAVQFIKNPQEEVWRIQVRPEAVAMLDYAQIKQERSDFLTAFSTFLQSAAPILEFDKNSLPFMLEMLKWTMAGFKGSNQIEGVLDKIISNATAQQKKDAMAPPEPSPEEQAAQAKLQAEQQKSQTQLQVTQMQAQADMAAIQQQSQADQQKFMAEMAKLRQEQQQSQMEFQQSMQKMAMEMQLLVTKFNGQIKLEEAKAEAAEEAAEGPETETETETEDES